MLSFDQFRSSQDVPHSSVTTTSSHFLTPPVTESAYSPPPRADADDYLDAKSRPKNRRRDRARHHSKRYSDQNRSDDGSRHRLLSSSTSALALAGSYSESVGSASPAVEVSSTPETPLIPLQKRPTYLDQLIRERSGPLEAVPEGRTSTGQFVAGPVEEASPAWESLRKLSQSGPTSSFEGVRRLSRSLTSNIGKFRPRFVKSDPRPKENIKAEDFAPVGGTPNYDQRRKSDGDDRCRRSYSTGVTHGPGSSNIPVSIILRKASVALALQRGDVVVTTDRQGNSQLKYTQPIESKSASSHLLAFRSTSSGSPDKQTTGSETPKGDAVPSKEYSGSQDNWDRENWKSLTSEGEVKTRSRSNTAGTALTVTDVYVAPGTFATAPRSRKSSIIASQVSRRISVVQFRSRNSVHEIIWREDESTSESTSSVNISPHQAELLSRADSINVHENASMSDDSKPGTLMHNGLPSHAVGPSFGVKENIFQWTWGKQPSSEHSQPEDLMDQPATNNYDQTQLQLSGMVQEGHKSSVGGKSKEVEATEEPRVFHPPRSEHSSKVEGLLAVFEGDRMATEPARTLRQESARAKSLGNRPPLIARTGECSRMGSSLGSSSGMRRVPSGAFTHGPFYH